MELGTSSNVGISDKKEMRERADRPLLAPPQELIESAVPIFRHTQPSEPAAVLALKLGPEVC